MIPKLRLCMAAFALVLLPGAALAVDNVWPPAPSPSLHFGWGSAGFEGFDAMPDGAGGFWAVMDNYSDTWVQHVLPSGRLAWPYTQRQVGIGGHGYGNPAICSDGAGGVLAAWEAQGGIPSQDLRLQRVRPDGSLAPGWPAGGVAVAPSSDYDYYCDLISDDSGGALVAFIRSATYQLYVAHVLSNGSLDPTWPADGVLMQPSGYTYTRPQIFPDQKGGAIVLYRDDSTGNLIAARVDVSGNVNGGAFAPAGLLLASGVGNRFRGALAVNGKVHVAWVDSRFGGQKDVFVNSVNRFGYGLDVSPTGLRLTSTAVNEDYPVINTDAAGNTVVAWVAGTSILGTRLKLDLTPRAEFPAGGVVVSANAGTFPYFPSAASDGEGGLLVTWADGSAPYSLFAQRLNPDGSIPSGWGANGNVLATSQNVNSFPVTIPDGDLGIVGVFGDQSLLGANRLRRNGRHGLMQEPRLTALNDVPNDQGGRLALYWRASEVDTLPANAAGSYFAWRRMPPLAAQALLARGAHMLKSGESPESAGPGALRSQPGASGTSYWEYLGSTPARGWPGYGTTVSTNSDPLGPGMPIPWEAYRIETVSPTGVLLGTSEPDSGYSIDNLSPAQPAAFTAVRTSGATHLHWSRSSEADFREYRLYRGADATFVPDDTNILATSPDTGFVDPSAQAAGCYKLAALDVHGNAGPYAVVTAAQTLGVGGAPQLAFAFASISPNPARHATALSFTLPVEAHVRIAVYDAQGRLARTLVDAPRGAGAHVEAWDLRDAAGRTVAPGLYLARIETATGSRVRRVAVVE